MFKKLHDGDASLSITIDGVPVTVEPGETVAAALLRQPEIWSRTTHTGAKRAPYCMMGVCFECVAEVDGAASVQTCLATVRDGMVVRRQQSARRLQR